MSLERTVAIVHRDLNRQIDEEVMALVLDQGYRGLIVVETWSTMEKEVSFVAHAKIYRAPECLSKDPGHHYVGLQVDEKFVQHMREARVRRHKEG